MPTHELSRTFKLGSLTDTRLSFLSSQWLSAGHGDRLSDACARTGEELAFTNPAHDLYWYEEVATRTRDQHHQILTESCKSQRRLRSALDEPVTATEIGNGNVWKRKTGGKYERNCRTGRFELPTPRTPSDQPQCQSRNWKRTECCK